MESAPAARRLFDGDVTIFEGDSARTRTGWLGHLASFSDTVAHNRAHWFDTLAPRHATTLLIGMGGSSAPAAMAAHLVGSNHLVVLDTSNPDTMTATSFTGVNVIASSKSGATIETVCALAWALSHGLDVRDLSIITDPTTPLAQLGESLGAKIFYGDPWCGGRFSALSTYGVLGALVAGWSPDELVATGGDAVERDEFVEWFERGAARAEAAPDDAVFDLARAPTTASVELWLEQLVAETTGKEGRGLVPVVGHHDGNSVRRATFARDVFRWHVDTSAMAWRLGVDPFSQPDVEESKRLVFAELLRVGEWTTCTTVTGRDLDVIARSTYVTLQVFAPLELERDIDDVRRRLGDLHPRVTAALGPRFLHSTGQMHKGGPAHAVAVQVQVRPRSRPERIQGRSYSFHDLHAAQARADAAALRGAGRHVIELRVDSLADVCTAFGV